MTQPLYKRLYQYQKERFPILVHIPLIISFSFSAIGYSIACRNGNGFIGLKDFAFCAFTNIAIFFMLRVSDEYKDKQDDALYRQYLPVPRGLVSLKELSLLAWTLFAIASLINIVNYATLLPLYITALVYLLLMRYEFFAAAWLKRHQLWYIISHMAIIPLADVYASSYDWKLKGMEAPAGLLFFLGVSYLNGMILEVGRKLRVPETEEYGVVSYTSLWGQRKAVVVWLSLLVANFALACIAESYAHDSRVGYIVLSSIFILSAIAGTSLLIKPAKNKTKMIELMSLIWALAMYLTLGGIPLLLKLTGISS